MIVYNFLPEGEDWYKPNICEQCIHFYSDEELQKPDKSYLISCRCPDFVDTDKYYNQEKHCKFELRKTK